MEENKNTIWFIVGLSFVLVLVVLVVERNKRLSQVNKLNSEISELKAKIKKLEEVEEEIIISSSPVATFSATQSPTP